MKPNKLRGRVAREGKDWVVDLDIEKFFDHVNHDILMTRIGQTIRDKRVLKLIGRYLRSGVMINGVVVETEEGTPQGGPLSPLLANIYLDPLDRELEKRGHSFSRYADDCNIYVGSEPAAKRVMETITEWIGTKLRLKVNASKSGIGRPWERKFLGFCLTQEGLLITASAKSLDRFKARVAGAVGCATEPDLSGNAGGVAKLYPGLVELLPAGRMATPHLRLGRLDSAAHPQMLLAAVAQREGASSGASPTGPGWPATQSGAQQ